MSVKAVAKNVSVSPRKVGEVASLVRGRSVADALVILSHTPRASAIPVRKAIESAKANADHNHNYKPDTLVITEISVTPGMRLKRFRPQARGSAAEYIKRSSHIRVIVDGEMRKPKTVKKEVKADSKPAKKGSK
ncbi:50S ribosomal protein L22 [Candidatus Saccharibacteria bacterium]|nr:50S ribosomal protein L22 [Candidatus Saccharibacteria bacterium]